MVVFLDSWCGLTFAAMELQSLEPPELDKEEQELTPGPSHGGGFHSHLGKWNHELTSRAKPGNYRLWEIIPFYGRTIQVSELW